MAASSVRGCFEKEVNPAGCEPITPVNLHFNLDAVVLKWGGGIIPGATIHARMVFYDYTVVDNECTIVHSVAQTATGTTGPDGIAHLTTGTYPMDRFGDWVSLTITCFKAGHGAREEYEILSSNTGTDFTFTFVLAGEDEL